ncbi:MAG: holo-ACP synthase [bacterium]|nr:MAG: holo-ACP synthase [bacterium]
MIKGIGVDIVSISRIARLIERYGERFLRKIFTSTEISEGTTRFPSAHYFAGRFAAREAFFKALGTGWGRGISLKEVHITASETGRPNISFSDRIAQICVTHGIGRSHLSITHEGDIAQAIVILESKS